MLNIRQIHGRRCATVDLSSSHHQPLSAHPVHSVQVKLKPQVRCKCMLNSDHDRQWFNTQRTYSTVA